MHSSVRPCGKAHSLCSLLSGTEAAGPTHALAQGSEASETLRAHLQGVSSIWTERRVLVRSQAAAHAAQTALAAWWGQQSSMP